MYGCNFGDGNTVESNIQSVEIIKDSLVLLYNI